MAQPRRPSASRHNARQHSEPTLNDSLKSIPPNNPTTPPYKRRATGNENKPKTPPTKRDPVPVAVIVQSSSAPAGTGAGNIVAGTSLTPQMGDLGHRRMVSGTITGGPRTNIIISLPTSGIVRTQSEVKMAPRDFDGLESTSKGDLQFPFDASDTVGMGNEAGESPDSIGLNDVSGGTTFTTSEMAAIDPGPTPETMDTRIPEVVDIASQTEEIYLPHPMSTVTSPAPPSRVLPLAPSTPKRQVKLATSNSSAAAWFATGPISSAKKKDPDPKDQTPAIEAPATELPEIHVPPSLIVEPDITPLLFNLAETSQIMVRPVIERHSPPGRPENVSVMQSEMSMTSIYLALDWVDKSDMLQIPLGPSTEMVGVTPATSGPAFSETFGMDTSVFMQCIFRPYARRATPVVSSSSNLPNSPEKHISGDIGQRGGMEMPLVPVDAAVNLAVLDDRPVTPMDDKSVDSIVLVQGTTSMEEIDGVRRRWFHEEMRQSPERDGIWTVEEGETSVPSPPEPVEVTPMEATVSSLSTDFVMVDVPVNGQATIKEEPTPVIDPPSTDNTVVEPTKAPIVSSATIEPPSEAKVSEPPDVSLATPIKQKFKVIGGRVVNILDTPKQDHAIPNRPEASTPGVSTTELLSEKTPVIQILRHEHSTFPQRKHSRTHSANTRRQSIAKSDGWSTEAEDGPSTAEFTTASTATEYVQVPGMVTDLPVADIMVPVEEFIAPRTLESEIPEIVVRELTTPPTIVAEQSTIVESTTTGDIPPIIELSVLPPTTSFTTVEESPAPSDAEDATQDLITTTTSSEAPTPAPSVTKPFEVTKLHDPQEESEKDPPKIDVKQLPYQIVEGKVLRKISGPSKVSISTPDPSGSTFPSVSPTRSTSSLPATGNFSPGPSSRRVRSESLELAKERIAAHISSEIRYVIAPPVPPPAVDTSKAAAVCAAAEKFVQCGPMADVPTTASLTRTASPWPGSPHHASERGVRPRPHAIGRDSKRQQEDAQFAYGKTVRINQPSRREESFDPYAHETPKSLKFLQERNRPVLESHDEQQLKEMFGSRPYCFCGMPCAQFNGVVPVYVCGMFQRGIMISEHTFGCSFHMHVPFWECLRDTFAWNKYDKVKTFSSDALVAHLNACPYLNFTFCVKFSQINDFNMYLPAEIKATNFCACDHDMRLDFSQILQQWAFSCPHYHQAGVPVKCVRRIFAHETRYKLLEESANLHGGASSLNIQTVVPADTIDDGFDEPFPMLRAAVHLPHMDENVPEPPAHDEDIFTDFYRAALLNTAGSRAWLGSTPTKEDIDTWTRRRQDWDRRRGEKVEQMREQYLRLEKLLDEALCEKIRQEEHMKREDARLRLRANVVTCLACCEASAMCVFLPCFHMVMCERCGEKVKQCPSCRRQVEDRQRVYTA